MTKKHIKQDTKDGSLSMLPLAAVMLIVLMWGTFVWIPESAGYELVLYHPAATVAVVTLLLTAIIAPLAFMRGEMDSVGGTCASVLPFVMMLVGILLLAVAGFSAAWAMVWLGGWSIAAAIRCGSRKGLRTFCCVIAGMAALAGIAMVLIISEVPEIKEAMDEEVVRSAVSPDGTLIAEEIGYGEEDSDHHTIRVRETYSVDALIGTLRRSAQALRNPFYGSGAIEELRWADDNAISLRIKGQDEPVLIQVRHKEAE